MTRKEAAEMIKNDVYLHHDYLSGEYRKALRMAIFALEQSEIIRCKDCKWYGRVDKRRFYRGMDCLQKHIDTIVPDRDFCSKAERRGEQDG